MATMEKRLDTVLVNNAVTSNLTPAQRQDVVQDLEQAVIPSTPIYIWIVVGLIVTLAFSIGGVFTLALRNVDNEIVTTGLIALATTSVGALAGALIPSRS